jgi:hypothetical protein
MSIKKKCLINRREQSRSGLFWAKLSTQLGLGPVVGAAMSLLVNDREHVGYPAPSSPKVDETVSVLHFLGHGSMTIGPSTLHG